MKPIPKSFKSFKDVCEFYTNIFPNLKVYKHHINIHLTREKYRIRVSIYQDKEITISFIKNGVLDSLDDYPAELFYLKSFDNLYNLRNLNWFRDGRYHRFNDPAVVYYSITLKGFKVKEIFYVNSNLHNIKGPAYRVFSLDLNCWVNCYYINNNKISLDDFCKLQDKLNDRYT